MSDAIRSRLGEIWHSYRSLPLWVQLWVGLVLVPVNALSLALLDHWAGRAAALAALAVVATNLPIMWLERGMSRLMAVPHLLIWGPLQGVLVLRLLERVGPLPVAAVECLFILTLLVVNGISLAFDALDTWRWLRGERAVPGRTV
ncbi:MAG TPA: hypothetical protein PLE54_09150 [Burkholderiaceae bacterium]|nr:hypothetical protein [Burkholderiaceae bacterium]